MNDGEELERSIRDMMKYASVSSERVGCTGWADEIPRRTVSAGVIHEGGCERSAVALSINGRKRHMMNLVIHFIHAGDEWYILAEDRDAGGGTL